LFYTAKGGFFIKFEKFSPKQRALFEWWQDKKYSAVIADGSIRSGKTLAMSLSFVLWATKNYNRQGFAFCGKTIVSLRRNVIVPLSEALRGVFAVKDYASKGYIEIGNRNICNRYYLFGGKDESSYKLIQGITLAGVMLDEVALMPKSFVEQAIARCSVAGSLLWFNCNPEHPRHWFYLEWIKKCESKNALHLHFTLDDNLSLGEAEKKRYMTLYEGAFFERYILGKWTTAEGKIMDTFSPKNICKTLPREYLYYYLSIDYGTVNPMSMGLWGYFEEKWVRVREYYYDSRREGRQKTDVEYLADMQSFLGGIVPVKIIIDPSAASFIACVKQCGYTVKRANNNVKQGIELCRTLFYKGTIMINDCCADFLEEIESYVWDKNFLGDRPVKEHDHSMDEMRYFVMSVIKRG